MEALKYVVHKPTGRTGIVRPSGLRLKTIVKFGADGPYESIYNGRLRPATIEEIERVTGQRS